MLGSILFHVEWEQVLKLGVPKNNLIEFIFY